MRLKTSSVKFRPFCVGRNVLKKAKYRVSLVSLSYELYYKRWGMGCRELCNHDVFICLDPSGQQATGLDA